MYKQPFALTGTSNILETAGRIERQSAEKESAYECSDYSPAGIRPSDHIGARFNEWRKPVTEFGSNDPDWEVNIKASIDFKNMDFNNKEWARSRNWTDDILNKILDDIKSDELKGLKVERYIRQGSSRDGLKVIAADEFDTLLQYHFEGFNISPVQVSKDDCVIPEFCFLEVSRDLSWLKTNYPKLCSAGVFEENKDGVVKLNARALHQRVFESMIDRSVKNITAKTEEAVKREEVPFRIRRKINPPSINITIAVSDTLIDVDIVPGILIRTDKVPDPFNSNMEMDCPVYAVFKWQEESKAGPEVFGAKADLLWRICSSGYEKHTLDVARTDRRMRYIITALRLLKTYCTTTKKRALAADIAPPPFTTVLRSYFLKHIAFYLILYLGYIHKDAQVSGVCDAITYFIAFLRISLEKEKLPHFFHSNKWITTMYPKYPTHWRDIRFNLFRGKSSEALLQAKLSLDRHLLPALRFRDSNGEYAGIDHKLQQVKQEYEANVSYGQFF